MDREPEANSSVPERRPVGFVALGIAAGLFFGFWGWVYQGYEEDAGTGEMQTWPIGLGGYLAAWVFSLIAFGRVRPAASDAELTWFALGLAVLLGLATIGSIVAGNG